MSRFVFILLFVSLAITSLGQPAVKMDTAAITARSFNKNALASLKNQKAFRYDSLTEPAVSFWDRFWNWFWFKVDQLLSTKGGKTTLWTLLYLFAGSMLVFFLFKITGMNKALLFGRGAGKGLAYTTSSEDINTIAFDDAVANAVSMGNYRLAVRLLYLQVLKNLSDRNIIQWQINKTNTDYVHEVEGKLWSPSFKKLTQNFEYTWYGETYIDSDTYQNIHGQFTQFNNQLK